MPKIAQKSMTIPDKGLGIDRTVIEGQPVPPDLLESYEEAGGTVKDSDPSQPTSLVAGPVVKATEDTVVDLEVAGVMVQRKVFAGEKVPPDLVDAYRKATSGETTSETKPTEPVDVTEATADSVSAESAPSMRRGRRA